MLLWSLSAAAVSATSSEWQVAIPLRMRVPNMGLKASNAAADIDDTEDYINIELDNHRNQLIRVMFHQLPWLGLTT